MSSPIGHLRSLALVCIACAAAMPARADQALVLQSDFGLGDAAVSAMKGVAVSVAPDLRIYDSTHDIPAFDIWAGALRLEQSAAYWPPGTVFVSVVDPGVGSDRKSVVLKTGSGHYFVTPDNGTLTFVAERLGIAAVREIDEALNRRSGSVHSHTFHGRDVYVYTGARLAAGIIAFEDVGRLLPPEVVRIPYRKPAWVEDAQGHSVAGNIPILDVRFGNVWTNIGRALFQRLGAAHGDPLRVTISSDGRIVYDGDMPYGATFSAVEPGSPVLYVNSLDRMALALNQGDFAERHAIGSGPGWEVTIRLAASAD